MRACGKRPLESVGAEPGNETAGALGGGKLLAARPGEGGALTVGGGIVEQREERGAEGGSVSGRDVERGLAEDAAVGGQVAGDDGEAMGEIVERFGGQVRLAL